MIDKREQHVKLNLDYFYSHYLILEKNLKNWKVFSMNSKYFILQYLIGINNFFNVYNRVATMVIFCENYKLKYG